MKLKTNIYKLMGSVAFSLMTAIGMTGCSDDLFDKNNGNFDPGKRIHGKVSVNFGSSSPTTATRAWTNFAPEATVKVDSYWLGIYDSRTGELLGTSYNEMPRKDNGTRYTLDNEDVRNPFIVEDVEIDYYENNPEAIIVGVINLNGVQAKNAGDAETKPLIDLLTEARTFSEYCKISVDVASAESANGSSGNNGEAPLMMGFYTVERQPKHITVSSNGELSSDAAKIRLNSSDKIDLNIEEGAVRLQRLLSEVNFTVMGTPYPQVVLSEMANAKGNTEVKSKLPEAVTRAIGDYEYGFDYSFVEIESLAYKVVNSPMEVYLTEHTTDYNAYSRTSQSDFLDNTANSADFSANYSDKPVNQYGEKIPGGEEGFLEVMPEYDEYYDMEIYNIKYQHYENKHYGSRDLPNNDKVHAARESKWDASADKPVFKSLCASESQDWNNNASYIVIKAKVYAYNIKMEWNDFDDYENIPDVFSGRQKIYEGTVYYTIHEGYTIPQFMGGNGIPNQPTWADPADYQTVRNTSYYYFVTLFGLDQFMMNVWSADYGQDPDYSHNDGISGVIDNPMGMEMADPSGQYYKNALPPMTIAERETKLNWIFEVPFCSWENGYPEIDYIAYGHINPDAGGFSDPDSDSDSMPFPFPPYGDELKGPNDMPEDFMKDILVFPQDGSSPNGLTFKEYLTAPGIDNVFCDIQIKEFVIPEEEKYDNFYLIDDPQRRGCRSLMVYFDDFYSTNTGCSIKKSMTMFQQYVLNDRKDFLKFELVGANYPEPSYRFPGILYESSIGSVCDITWKLEGYNPADYKDENDPMDPMNFVYTITVPETSLRHTFKARDYYNPANNTVTYPLYMSLDALAWPAYVNNGFIDVEIHPEVSREFASEYNAKKYQGRNFEKVLYVPVVNGDMFNQSTVYNNAPWLAQWQFTLYDDHSAEAQNMYYNRFYDYYSVTANQYGKNFESIGLTIKGKSDRQTISRTYNGYNYIRFGGGGTFNTNPDNDSNVCIFRIDRPGCIQVYFTFPSDDNGTADKTLVVSSRSDNNINWAIKRPIELAKKGELQYITLTPNDIDWPTEWQRFDEPMEIGIYSEGGAYAIHAIRFLPNSDVPVHPVY